jgi:hypothetical protein
MSHVHGAANAVKNAAEHVGRGHGMGSMMANMPAHYKFAAGAGATVAAKSSGGILHALGKHPLLVFGVGIMAGYLAHKYRKEIINGVSLAAEQGKDFVLHQKENLEDLVAECHEKADEAGGTKKG